MFLNTGNTVINAGNTGNTEQAVNGNFKFVSKRNKPPQINIPVSQDNSAMSSYGKCQYCIGEVGGFFRTWLPCIFCLCFDYPYLEVDQGNEGLMKRFGRHSSVVKPGLHYVNPCTDTLQNLDLRITVLDLARQSIMTRDNVTINIDASVYYHIVSSRYASYRVYDANMAVTQVTYAILKNIIGTFTLQELLEKRHEVTEQIEKQVEQYVENWGVQIDNMFIKDIQLSRDLQDALSSAATEQRRAQSKLITAKADVEAAKLMREAAQFLDSNTAMQIRYLETIGMLGSAHGTKVCFIQEEKDKNKLMHSITQGLLI